MAWSLVLELLIDVAFEDLTGCVSVCWFEAHKSIRQYSVSLYMHVLWIERKSERSLYSLMPSITCMVEHFRPMISSPMLAANLWWKIGASHLVGVADLVLAQWGRLVSGHCLVEWSRPTSSSSIVAASLRWDIASPPLRLVDGIEAERGER
jgi:hypothetical protein